MSRCKGCGGILGTHCFNERECVWITEDENNRNAQDAQNYRHLMDHIERESEEAPGVIASMAKQITELESEIIYLKDKIVKLNAPIKLK